jgi:hypothetical protein
MHSVLEVRGAMDKPENAVLALRAAVLVKLDQYAKRLQAQVPTLFCEVGRPFLE